MFRRHVSAAILRGVRYSATETGGNTAATASAEVSPVKKETLVQQWKRFWKFLYTDYKDVAVGVVEDINQRPRKAASYIGLLSALFYAAKTNPDERHHRQAVVQAMDDMVMVSRSNLNPVSYRYLTDIQTCYNQGVIRRLSLGFLSFIWIDEYDTSCGIYQSQCSYLQAGILDFHQRVVDVGFLGKWWNLDSHMTVYDINPEEFPEK